ncbi:hypothetical protein BVG16_24750 [Paenibacillus selenitireducens]|uniref:ABC transporter permease n=1 Tax=Paenibacillus selenitireducens TaxID=1324314 RepID=A0A1T2X3F3_9BACL|nr:ABC transporter permease subunit [Paenibacillus selenitireducens]OPA74335.1 hypothetical protein BVG16_24750 [Paenibacillus selenitireducens]
MRQTILFYRKEMLEMARNYKWIWVPLVFLLLGVMQPIMSYYMPEILQHAGNMPEGTVISMPTPTGGEVLAQTLSQYSVIGVLILVLSMMGMVASERQSGVASLIFAKPVSIVSYILAKWCSAITITAVSFLLGYAAAWYYTVQLIGPIQITHALAAGGVYLLWLCFVVSVTVLVSVGVSSTGGVAFVSLAFIALLSFISSLFAKVFMWSPSQLSGLAAEWLHYGESARPTFAILFTSIGSMALLLAVAMFIMRRKSPIGTHA